MRRARKRKRTAAARSLTPAPKREPPHRLSPLFLSLSSPPAPRQSRQSWPAAAMAGTTHAAARSHHHLPLARGRPTPHDDSSCARRLRSRRRAQHRQQTTASMDVASAAARGLLRRPAATDGRSSPPKHGEHRCCLRGSTVCFSVTPWRGQTSSR